MLDHSQQKEEFWDTDAYLSDATIYDSDDEDSMNEEPFFFSTSGVDTIGTRMPIQESKEREEKTGSETLEKRTAFFQTKAGKYELELCSKEYFECQQSALLNKYTSLYFEVDNSLKIEDGEAKEESNSEPFDFDSCSKDEDFNISPDGVSSNAYTLRKSLVQYITPVGVLSSLGFVCACAIICNKVIHQA